MAKKKDYELLNREEILFEIMKKKEFSDLPKKDVSFVYSQFEKREVRVQDKIKLTRDLLRKMYTAFVSDKLLNVKDKEPDWFIRKHISTSERREHYFDLYKKIFVGMDSFPLVVDFGCGVNGFSFEYFKKVGVDAEYLGIEPVGQLVELQNNYFKKNKIYDANCVKASLFDLNKIKNIVAETKTNRVGFFFKVLDSLEMLKHDYSKIVLKELMPYFQRGIISWATSSLVSKKKFHANRRWLKEFIEKEFFIIEEFDLGNEHYLVFENKE